MGGIAHADDDAAGDAYPGVLPRQAAAGKADQRRAAQGHADGAQLASGDGLAKEEARYDGHPDGRDVHEDDGHGRAAELDGVLGDGIEHADAPDAEKDEVRRHTRGDGYLAGEEGVSQKEEQTEGRPPEGGLQRRDALGHADLGEHAHQRSEEGRKDDPEIAACRGRGG